MELGGGRDGTYVYLITDTDTQEQYAYNFFSKEALTTPEDVEDMGQEIIIMHRLSHYPYINSHQRAFCSTPGGSWGQPKAECSPLGNLHWIKGTDRPHPRNSSRSAGSFRHPLSSTLSPSKKCFWMPVACISSYGVL